MYSVPKLDDYSPAALDRAIGNLRSALEQEVSAVKSEADHEALRIRWRARTNGILTQINDQWLKAAPKEAKRDVGQRVNELKTWVEAKIEAAKYLADHFEPLSDEEKAGFRERAIQAITEARVARERLDITLPGIRRPLGAEHPVVKTTNEIIGIFAKMGYSVETGPEIETDYYNFESMNFPPNHPARDTQDTIFIAGQESKPQRDRLLLRTHTSPVQTRAMEKHRPPIRVVAPGKVHRSDTPDASHSPIFHQVEGLAVDTNITFSDLKGTLDHAMKELFGSDVKTRFFPSFFPFTEPSADVQVPCFKCGGKGCRLCKMSGWIELLGCGMVNPKVLAFHKDNGYDPEKVSGFAFGMGVERIAMLKYGIDDIQLFFHGDVRFLEQFA
jgi:phenylalanyl-tRNA synthetase alpha chain